MWLALTTQVHLAHNSGRTAGAPWCRSDPSVAAADRQTAVTTAVEADVTCPECLGHIRRYTCTADPAAIDWFGEG